MENKFQKYLFIGIMIFGIIFTSCNNSKKNSAKQNSDTEHTYSCPMHPEITGNANDTCSKCGMALEETSSEDAY